MPISPLKSPLGLAVFAFLAAGTSSHATVTLQLGSTLLQATNWADGAGAGGNALAWGIIVDRNGDGLAANYMTAGVDYGAAGIGQRLPQVLTDGFGAVTDDVLFMAPLVMSLVGPPFFIGGDDVVIGQNRITAISSIPYLSGIETGDAFHVVWFDRAAAPSTAPSGAPVPGDHYGIFSDPSFTIPGDGSTVSYAAAFAGADPLKQMTYQFAPEPSAAVLALLGGLGLVRRRR